MIKSWFFFKDQFRNLFLKSIFYCFCMIKIHYKMLSFLCIKILVGECIEDKIIKIQSMCGRKWSISASCNYFFPKSIISQPQLLIGLFKSLSPCKFWNKLFNFWVGNAIVGHSHLLSQKNSKIIKSSYFIFLICTFKCWIFCKHNLYPR